MEHSPSAIESFDFEKQFKNRETLDLFGTPFDVVDIQPEQLKTEVPILIAPGWTENMDSFKENMRLLAASGRRVLCLEHPRTGSEMNDVDEDLKKLYPVEELRKALAILSVIEQKGLDKVDIIAHSEGGINTAIAAVLETERFNHIVFANSAGMIGSDNFPKLTNRFNASTLGEITDLLYSDDLKRQTALQGILSRTVEYIGSNPLRATKESAAIASVQIPDMIGYLHDEGVGITVLTSEEDKIFPPERVQEMLDEKHVDHFLSMPGGHMEITKNPEDYMKKIIEVLDEAPDEVPGTIEIAE